MNRDTIIHRWLNVPYRLRVHYEKRVKKPRATLLFIHGIGASSKAWDKVISKLPKNVNIVTVDLLGFGLSPRPAWAAYDAKRQARAVIHSCRKEGVRGKVIVVGHSMGALVAIEMAAKNPRFISSLILCSPPLYVAPNTSQAISSNQKALSSLYSIIQSHPEQFVKISRVAAKYGIINRAFHVDEENVHSYMHALEASIVNQTSFDDIQQIKKPIRMIYGTLDPVVVTKNLKRLTKLMPNLQLKSVVAAHEIKGPYITVAARLIEETLAEQDEHLKK